MIKTLFPAKITKIRQKLKKIVAMIVLLNVNNQIKRTTSNSSYNENFLARSVPLSSGTKEWYF